eukprot:5369436-Pleurochrysis_carterae.AAC.3
MALSTRISPQQHNVPKVFIYSANLGSESAFLTALLYFSSGAVSHSWPPPRKALFPACLARMCRQSRMGRLCEVASALVDIDHTPSGL